MIGVKQPSLQDMPAFLSHGLKQLTHTMKAPKRKVSLLLQSFDEVAVCKAIDKSLLGAFSAVAADYFHRVNAEGGVAKANIGAIISAVSMVGGALGGSDAGRMGMVFGVAAVILLPLLYGCMGFVGSLIGASLFNLAAGWVGGIELDTQ